MEDAGPKGSCYVPSKLDVSMKWQILSGQWFRNHFGPPRADQGNENYAKTYSSTVRHLYEHHGLPDPPFDFRKRYNQRSSSNRALITFERAWKDAISHWITRVAIDVMSNDPHNASKLLAHTGRKLQSEFESAYANAVRKTIAAIYKSGPDGQRVIGTLAQLITPPDQRSRVQISEPGNIPNDAQEIAISVIRGPFITNENLYFAVVDLVIEKLEANGGIQNSQQLIDVSLNSHAILNGFQGNKARGSSLGGKVLVDPKTGSLRGEKFSLNKGLDSQDSSWKVEGDEAFRELSVEGHAKSDQELKRFFDGAPLDTSTGKKTTVSDANQLEIEAAKQGKPGTDQGNVTTRGCPMLTRGDAILGTSNEAFLYEIAKVRGGQMLNESAVIGNQYLRDRNTRGKTRLPKAQAQVVRHDSLINAALGKEKELAGNGEGKIDLRSTSTDDRVAQAKTPSKRPDLTRMDHQRPSGGGSLDAGPAMS